MDRPYIGQCPQAIAKAQKIAESYRAKKTDEIHLLFVILQEAGADKPLQHVLSALEIDAKEVLAELSEKLYKEMEPIPFSQELKETLEAAVKSANGQAGLSDLLMALLRSKSEAMSKFRAEHELEKDKWESGEYNA